MIQLGYFSKGESVCFCRSLRKLLQSTSEGTSRLGCTTLQSDFFPVENEAFPGGDEAFPVEHKAFPGRNEAFPVENEAFPRNETFCRNPSGYFAPGCMDDFRIYSQTLTEEEIAELYNLRGYFNITQLLELMRRSTHHRK